MGDFWNYVKNHAGVFIGMGVGVLIAVLLLVIGFWPVLLILVLGALGAVLGGIPTVRMAFSALLRNMFHSNKNE